MSKQETYDQKKRRLFGKQFLSTYLSELNALVNFQVSEQNLLSIINSDEIKFTGVLNSEITVNFIEKEKFLEKIIQSVSIKYPGKEFYLWTKYSAECGLLPLKTLSNFNTKFSFHSEHSGIIIIFSLKSKILLDCYEEDDTQLIDIETYF